MATEWWKPGITWSKQSTDNAKQSDFNNKQTECIQFEAARFCTVAWFTRLLSRLLNDRSRSSADQLPDNTDNVSSLVNVSQHNQESH